MKRMLKLAAAGVGCTLMLAACSQMPWSRDGGWLTLIDGDRGLENWQPVADANWHAQEGAIVADHKTEKASAFLLSPQSYRDFQMHVEFWVSNDANSGIYMRCADPKTLTDKTCYEANIFDQRPDPTYGTGSLVHVASAKPMPKAGGRWNSYDITVKGTRITIVLNGQRTVDVDDRTHAAGPIALQYAAGVVKFRKVQIRPL